MNGVINAGNTGVDAPGGEREQYVCHEPIIFDEDLVNDRENEVILNGTTDALLSVAGRTHSDEVRQSARLSSCMRPPEHASYNRGFRALHKRDTCFNFAPLYMFFVWNSN